MATSPLAVLRGATLGLGAGSAVLLVRALDAGLAEAPRDLSVGHGLAGVLLAAAVMPGTVLGFCVRPDSGEKARGLAVAGCVVTGLVALVGGAMLYHRAFGLEGGNLTVHLSLGWCALALPTSLLDGLRLRGSGEEPPKH